MVFQQLTGAYLQEWGDKWTERAPQRLVELFSFQQEKRPDPEKKVVFLSQVLPAAINLGYQQYSGLVLERVNGEEIRNLAELSKRVDEVEGEFLIFEFTDDPGKLVLTRRKRRRSRKRLGKRMGFRNLESCKIG